MKGKIVAGVLAPHPPHLVYAENPPQNEPKAEAGWEMLRWGYDNLREILPDTDYDVLIVHSPHWPTRIGHHLLAVPEMKGFSVDPVFPHLFRYNYDLKVDVGLSGLIAEEGAKLGLETILMKNPDFRVDYGTIISCHLVNPKWNKPIVAISSNQNHFDFSNEYGQDQVQKLGTATKAAVQKSGKRAVLLASCSLSHRHYTVEPDPKEDMSKEHVYHHGQYLWDMRILKQLKAGKTREVFGEMSDFIEQAVSEVKAGSLSWLLSSLDFPTYPARIHAYGSVIGTGNAIMSWHPEFANQRLGFTGRSL